MGIRANFDFNEIDRYIEDKTKILDTLILRNLNYLGMQCVLIAKTLDTYQDQTANLRNSIGYVVVKNGTIIESVFEGKAKGNAVSDKSGEEVGKTYAQEIALKFPTGYALIVVAGMNYASYVEDVHGLAVLQPAKDFATSKAEGILKKLIEQMKRAK